MKHQGRKEEIYKNLAEFDNLIEKKLKQRSSVPRETKGVKRSFFVLWLLSSIAPIWTLSNHFDSLLAWYAVITNHLIEMQMTQIALFIIGIENRLRIITDKFVSEKTFEIDYKTMQGLLLKLHHINQLVLRNFWVQLILNVMQLYVSIIIHSYWIGKMIIIQRGTTSIIGNI